MVMAPGKLEREIVDQVGIGPRLSDTPESVRTLGVTTGKHTREILNWLECEAADVSWLIENGAVVTT